MSSDSGLLLIKEFAHKFGFDKHISPFETDENHILRRHKDRQNFSQLIYQILAGYFNDNDADELTHEPVFKSILKKDALASQPTLSRFWNRMGAETVVNRFEDIIYQMRSSAYRIQMPE